MKLLLCLLSSFYTYKIIGEVPFIGEMLVSSPSHLSLPCGSLFISALNLHVENLQSLRTFLCRLIATFWFVYNLQYLQNLSQAEILSFRQFRCDFGFQDSNTFLLMLRWPRALCDIKEREVHPFKFILLKIFLQSYFQKAERCEWS